jgi:hypothetical protein
VPRPHRIPDAPLELPDDAPRFRCTLLLGGFPDDDRAVVADEHDGRHLHGPDPQAERLHPAVDVHRGGGVGGPEIDAQPVAHGHP